MGPIDGDGSAAGAHEIEAIDSQIERIRARAPPHHDLAGEHRLLR
jgi:hypothetical protein